MKHFLWNMAQATATALLAAVSDNIADGAQ